MTTRYAPATGIRCLLSIIFLSMAVGAILAGCAAVGPDYRRVEPVSSQKWHARLDGGLSALRPSPEVLAHWWMAFKDPILTKLEERAVKSNLDLKEALLRVREARALRSIERSALFPAFDVSGAATRQRNGEPVGTRKAGSLFSAGLDAAWELDIFGGRRRAIEAAKADIEAAKEDLHGVMVSLLAEVALNYVEVRTYQARLSVTRADISAQEGIYRLNRSRYHAGIINGLAMRQSLYNLERTRSLIPSLEAGIEKSKNRLAILLGQRPGTLDSLLGKPCPIPVPPRTIAVGIPAETLRRRPDIRRAERNLAAATARVGIATAELYPRFRLAGTIGLESISSGEFLKWSSRIWSVGPGISWKIFHAGAIRAGIKVQTARQEQALVRYEAAVLKAQEEVEDALVSYVRQRRQRDSLKAAAAAARQAYELALDQYQAGLVDFTNVLDAQQALQSLRDALAQSEGGVSADVIRLYKALGGGWKPADPP